MDAITIRVSTEVLKETVSHINAKMNNVKRAFEEIEDVVNASSQYWDSDGHDTMNIRFNAKKDQCTNSIAELKKHFEKLMRIANVYEASEMYAEDTVEELLSDVIV